MTEQKNSIVNLCESHKDGFTADFNLNIVSHNKGFYVGITNNTIKSREDLVLLFEKFKVIKNKLFKNRKNIFIGGWFDDVNKLFYVDLSLYIESHKTAVTTAEVFNQKAIFNIQKLNSETIK